MKTFSLFIEFTGATLVKNYRGFRCTVPQHVISALYRVCKGPSEMTTVERVAAMGFPAALMKRRRVPLGGMDTSENCSCGHV